MNAEIEIMMDKTGFPEEAKDFLRRAFDTLYAVPEYRAAYDRAVKSFMSGSEKYGAVCGLLEPIWKSGSVHEYTVKLLFFMSCSEILHEKYREAGVSDEIFYTSMTDLRCKAVECKNVKGIWGSFVSDWFPGFFDMSRFGLGRFQYEFTAFNADEWSRAGITLRRGDRVINMHIPSTGEPLTEKVRFDSYKKAYDFYREKTGLDIIPFVCSSWLLYPAHREFLPNNSHILDFMDDFDIIRSDEHDSFGDIWRVFGADSDKAPYELPEDTSLRRAYKKRLTGGGKTGGGYGVFLFDGEKIL